MAILVKRFRVRYNGVTYGPGQLGGQIIAGLSEEEEARLIEGSNGAIEKYVAPQVSDAEVPAADDGKEEVVASAGDTASEPEASAQDTEPEPELPVINPADLIRPKKQKRR